MDNMLSPNQPMCEGRIAPVTLTQRLTRQRDDLADRLAKVNAALDALQANPKLGELFDLVSQV